MSKQDDLYLPTNEQAASSNLIMPKIFITILFSSFLLASPVYAENGFQYLKPIQTDNLPGYKSVVLDKDVYAHSNHLQDLRIFNETDEEVPYVLDSIHEAATSKEKASFIQSEEAPFVTTQVSNDTVISIKVNQLSTFRLELNTDDMFERNYALFGINGETKWYLSEGTLVNLPLDHTLPTNKDIVWADTNSIDQLQLIIHNRDNKPINLKSIRISYYLNKLVFKDLGNTHYRLAYGNEALHSPLYAITDYKATVIKETPTQATLGAEVSTPPKTQLPEIPTNHTLLFTLTISALVLLSTISIGLRWWRKSPPS